jgi:hypothetical protein
MAVACEGAGPAPRNPLSAILTIHASGRADRSAGAILQVDADEWDKCHFNR